LVFNNERLAALNEEDQPARSFAVVTSFDSDFPFSPSTLMETAGKNIRYPFISKPTLRLTSTLMEAAGKSLLIYFYFSPKLNYLEDLQD
jgi:hypothetical protein